MPLTNVPKILRGAFVEYGLSVPPLLVVFQFNPDQLTRSRRLSFLPPNQAATDTRSRTPTIAAGTTTASTTATDAGHNRLRKFHQSPIPKSEESYSKTELQYIQEHQLVNIGEESISFDIRLDATDDLNDGDVLAGQFGILARLSTLEMMMLPKMSDSELGGFVDDMPGLGGEGFSPTKQTNPPMVLFIWGRQKVLPVNITSMNITETEFSTNLNPIRATVSVSLTVIEGGSRLYTYSKAMTEAMSVLNLANVTEIANVVIPG